MSLGASCKQRSMFPMRSKSACIEASIQADFKATGKGRRSAQSFAFLRTFPWQ